MAKQWFVQREDKVFGPFHSAKLKALAKNGQVTESTQVALHESGPWVNADKVRGLFTTTPPAQPSPAAASMPPDPMPDAQPTPAKETPADQEPAEDLANMPTSAAISRLQKVFPTATLTRCGGEVLVSVFAGESRYAGDRWGFFIAAKTDKKGEMKATIEYGPDKDSPKRMRARRPIADFSGEHVSRLACDMVDKQIKQTGSTVWNTMIRSVNYAAIITVDYAQVLRQGDAYVVSLQTRKMRLDSRTLAPEPCTAEITRGRKLWETTANGLEIDDAYNALDRVLNELLCGQDDEDDDCDE